MKLLEIIICIAILVILAGLASGSLGGLRRADALVSSTETVLSALNTARSQTLAARGGVHYGVHFASTTVTIFPGSTWSSSNASNTVMSLVPGVVVAALQLQGGGADIVFQRLTGKTAQYGTTTLQFQKMLATSTITVQSTGSISSYPR